MLVHPEIAAILNRLRRSDQEAPKKGPRVTRGDEAGKGDPDKPRNLPAYTQKNTARGDEVDYLNERDSKVSFYA